MRCASYLSLVVSYSGIVASWQPRAAENLPEPVECQARPEPTRLRRRTDLDTHTVMHASELASSVRPHSSILRSSAVHCSASRPVCGHHSLPAVSVSLREQEGCVLPALQHQKRHWRIQASNRGFTDPTPADRWNSSSALALRELLVWPVPASRHVCFFYPEPSAQVSTCRFKQTAENLGRSLRRTATDVSDRVDLPGKAQHAASRCEVGTSLPAREALGCLFTLTFSPAPLCAG